MTSTVGILLAGGLSRRFGSPKAFAEIDGKTFYEKAYLALDSVCDKVVIISRPELLSRFSPGLDVITDLEIVAGQGPLAGIFTAMSERPAEQYMVLPCDMPFIGPAEAKALMNLLNTDSDVTAVQSKDDVIPLFSIWNVRVKDELQNELSNGQFRVMKFMDRINTKWVETSIIHDDQATFRNLNKPDY